MGSILSLQNDAPVALLEPFQFEGAVVRVIAAADGEALFVGRDVCDALGYANAADAITRHCKGVAKHYPLQTRGGVQEARVLAEPDVLRLIVHSKLPAAVAFERWVFEQVLPTIRRTGSYTAPVPAPTLPKSFAEALRLAADQQEVIETQAAQLAAAAPAVEFVERYADSTGTKGFREVAKLLQANEVQFREFLIDDKIMYRLAGALTPYGHHIDAGRFCVKAGTAQHNGHAYNAARFTSKGVTWVAGEWAKWKLKQREVDHA